MSFLGYERNTGVGGARNYVAVVASVICSTTPVREIGASFPDALPVVHQYGCAQMGDDLFQTRRTLVGLAANPNVAAALVVGLGCENNQAPVLAQSIPSTKPVEVIGIQELGSSEKTVRRGNEIVERLIRETRFDRVPLSADRLCVGIVGVEPDAETLGTVYPVVGRLVDALVRSGARVVIGVGSGLAPAGSRLAERASEADAAERLVLMSEGLRRRRWQDPAEGKVSFRKWTDDESAQSEKELAITGSVQIDAVLDYAERPSRGQVSVMAVPSNPVEAMTGLVAGGAGVIVAASSRGLLSGALGTPTLVVAPAHGRFSALDELVDVPIAEDSDPVRDRVLDTLYAVASGEESATERQTLSSFARSQVGTPF